MLNLSYAALDSALQQYFRQDTAMMSTRIANEIVMLAEEI